MKIRELTIQEFVEFANSNPLNNYMQSPEYARLMGEIGYNYDYIGLVDNFGKLLAASIILWKKIGLNNKYGYAPKGFLVNYYDEVLLKEFSLKLIDYYKKKKFALIKINPEIVVGQVNSKTLQFRENRNLELKTMIPKYGYQKLKDNLYFESIVPRFNAYIDLKTAKFANFSKSTRNKINNAKRKGLYTVIGDLNDIDDFYSILNTKRDIKYYRDVYTLFSESDNVELVLIKADFEVFIKKNQELYERELDKNGLYNEILHRSQKQSDLNRKMNSDSLLCTIKSEIIDATEGLRDFNNKVVAGAILIKHGNRIHIFASAYDKKLSKLNANYFLYNELIERYKDSFAFLDIGGISGDFKKDSPYHNLNRFKMGFNPNIYEFIGEFDLIVNSTTYNSLLLSGKLATEFNKKEK